MTKPVCVPCGKFFRPKRNGALFEEGRPLHVPPDGAEVWGPYKLWMSDLWECKGCGTQIMLSATMPLAEHYFEAKYERMKIECGPVVVFVKDC